MRVREKMLPVCSPCGGDEEIDPDNSFIENYKNVNWRANDGFAFVWVTENYFFYYDALSNICSKFPLNGTANFGINGFSNLATDSRPNVWDIPIKAS